MTDAVEVELKPCPFCGHGGPDIAEEMWAGGDFVVECKDCEIEVRIRVDSRIDAEAIWQARAARPIEDTLRADNARLKRELGAAREGWRTDVEPLIPLAEVKRFLRIEDERDDAKLRDLTRDAMARIESRARIAFSDFGAPVDVPAPLRQAVFLLVADAREHQESEVGFARTSSRIDALIGPWRGPRL